MKKIYISLLKSLLYIAFISYYEDDNDGFQPKWEDIFGGIGYKIVFPIRTMKFGQKFIKI